jgi:hypothetical protein
LSSSIINVIIVIVVVIAGAIAVGRCANVQTAGNDTRTNTHFVIGSLQLLQHSSTPDLIQVHIENGVTLSAHDYKSGFMSCNTKGV